VAASGVFVPLDSASRPRSSATNLACRSSPARSLSPTRLTTHVCRRRFRSLAPARPLQERMWAGGLPGARWAQIPCHGADLRARPPRAQDAPTSVDYVAFREAVTFEESIERRAADA